MLCGIVIFVMVFSVSVIIFGYREMKKSLTEKKALEEQLDSYSHMVYVTVENLTKGSIISEENLNREVRYSDIPEEEFITEQNFGMALALDVGAGTCLTNNMLYNPGHSVREVFLSEVGIPEYLQTGDRVDIRIRYENAEDYTVLADKILVECESGGGMVLELTEEEILLLSSAITDTEKYSNTWLYAVKYPEYKAMDSSIVNYIANSEILALLGKEKTKGESRTALERRLLRNQ